MSRPRTRGGILLLSIALIPALFMAISTLNPGIDGVLTAMLGATQASKTDNAETKSACEKAIAQAVNGQQVTNVKVFYQKGKNRGVDEKFTDPCVSAIRKKGKDGRYLENKKANYECKGTTNKIEILDAARRAYRETVAPNIGRDAGRCAVIACDGMRRCFVAENMSLQNIRDEQLRAMIDPKSQESRAMLEAGSFTTYTHNYDPKIPFPTQTNLDELQKVLDGQINYLELGVCDNRYGCSGYLATNQSAEARVNELRSANSIINEIAQSERGLSQNRQADLLELLPALQDTQHLRPDLTSRELPQEPSDPLPQLAVETITHLEKTRASVSQRGCGFLWLQCWWPW